MRFLVTAGNTREMIDAVRDWGNIFTGNTGFAIANAIAEHGKVDLVTSNAQHLAALAAANRPFPILGSSFKTHADLRGVLGSMLARHKYDAIFMTAAVADYRPWRVFAVVERKAASNAAESEVWQVRDVQAGKIKSTHQLIAILGEPTEKIVDLFRSEWKHTGLLVKFKLEVDITVDELLAVGEKSRIASQADYLVANTLAMVNGDSAGAFLIGPAGHEWVRRDDLPRRMAQLVAALPPK